MGALSVGEHTIGIVSTSGTATTTFTVKAKTVEDKNTNPPQTEENDTNPPQTVESNTNSPQTVESNTNSPQTGDSSHIVLWVLLLFVSGGLLVITGIFGKKYTGYH